jgi:hypothetical protein
VIEGVFQGREQFDARLRDALLLACADACRELFCFDSSFADWPLADPELLTALTAWARPGRRLHLLAAQYDDLTLRQPRFVQWRARFGHCVEARAYEAELGAGRPLAATFFGLGAAQPVCLRLFDAGHWRGAVSRLPADTLLARECFDAMAQRSCESFAATTLGL